jgi:branched-chain amino acid transport system substrate-binding protein
VGGPTAIKQGNLNNQVFQVSALGAPNIDYAPSQAFEKAFRSKYGFAVASAGNAPAVTEMWMLAAAADKAKSLEPVKIALALEGMEFEVFRGGRGYMRKDDHQFFQPMYMTSFGELTSGESFDEENTGWGWKVVETIETAQTVLPTTCKMIRPTEGTPLQAK